MSSVGVENGWVLHPPAYIDPVAAAATASVTTTAATTATTAASSPVPTTTATVSPVAAAATTTTTAAAGAAAVWPTVVTERQRGVMARQETPIWRCVFVRRSVV